MLSVDVDNTVTYVINQQAAGYRTDNYVTAGNLRLLLVGVIAMTTDPTGLTYNGVAYAVVAGTDLKIGGTQAGEKDRQERCRDVRNAYTNTVDLHITKILFLYLVLFSRGGHGTIIITFTR